MTTMDICCPKPVPRIRALFGALLRRYRSERQLRRNIRYLEDLDDHILRDIGVRRTHIRAALQHGRRDK